jgi:hypothetical protein
VTLIDLRPVPLPFRVIVQNLFNVFCKFAHEKFLLASGKERR